MLYIPAERNRAKRAARLHKQRQEQRNKEYSELRKKAWRMGYKLVRK
jgi:hypothetical protein